MYFILVGGSMNWTSALAKQTTAPLKAEVIKFRSGQEQGWVITEVDRFDIEANTEDELFAVFFREYENRHKYINHLSFRLADKQLAARYNTWISDVNNYANNGGDMW